ncbi:hypothetical protein L0M90_13265, partial [[Ruminococcus] torques]|uniref:hypothetical protein n=1 Tax=[Ruminococcus] torques TaxID=33039 RepID=UPI001EDEA6A5
NVQHSTQMIFKCLTKARSRDQLHLPSSNAGSLASGYLSNILQFFIQFQIIPVQLKKASYMFVTRMNFFARFIFSARAFLGCR